MTRRRRPAVAVTHELEERDALVGALEDAGASVLCWSVVRTAPPEDGAACRAALNELERFDWIVFTSRRAVDAVHDLGRTIPTTLRVAAVGPRVAQSVRSAGWPLTLVGTGGGAALAEALAPRVSADARVLFPAGEQASTALEEGLRSRGAAVHRVHVYRTEPVALDGARCRAALESSQVDAVTFLSPSAVQSTVASLDTEGCARMLRRVPALCIGTSTGDSAREAGFGDVHESPEHKKDAVARLLGPALGMSLATQPQPSP